LAVPVVDEVTIQRAKAPPVRVVLRVSHLEGLAAVTSLLRARLLGVPLEHLVEMHARVADSPLGGTQPIEVWQLNAD
jgi:metal-dependent HD superfamily phosphatase/phosphodiesterase